MGEKERFEPTEMSTIGVVVLFLVGSLVVLSLAAGYFLGLGWLLTVLAPLTFPQAVAVAVLVLASGFLILARLPSFDLSTIIIIGLAFSAIALVAVLLARLVAAFTALSVWDASLLLVATEALLLFIVVQMLLDAAPYEEFSNDDDDDDDGPSLRRLSPDMYILRNLETEIPRSRRRRTSRRRSRRRDDESDNN